VNAPGADARASRGNAAPAVSIGLPVYNGARFLGRALDSLLSQQRVSFEILVSDNASTDTTSEIAEAYAARDARIRVSRSVTNLGVEANFARVLQEASGTYFMWAACDDWWAPEFLSTLVTALENRPDAAVAMSAVERVDESGRLVDVVRFGGPSDPARLTPWQLTLQIAGGRPYHLFIYGLYRTGFIKRAFTGFAPVIAADRLFMCRVAMAAPFAYVDDVLHRRVVRHASIADRYPDEQIGRLWRGTTARWQLALAAGPYLWRSPVLPRGRRAWVPAVVLRFAKAALGYALVTGRGSRRGGASAIC
jgi:glycosyltransferase involved in cell wall biosynthesis